MCREQLARSRDGHRVRPGQRDPEIARDRLLTCLDLHVNLVVAGRCVLRRSRRHVDARRASGFDDRRRRLLLAGDLGLDLPVGVIRDGRRRGHRHVLGGVVVEGQGEREVAVRRTREGRRVRRDRDVAGCPRVDADADRQDVAGAAERGIHAERLGRGGRVARDRDVEAGRGVDAGTRADTIDDEAAAVKCCGPAGRHRIHAQRDVPGARRRDFEVEADLGAGRHRDGGVRGRDLEPIVGGSRLAPIPREAVFRRRTPSSRG